MRFIRIERDAHRWTQQRYEWNQGEWEFENLYLMRKATLVVCGIRLWSWWETVRMIPVHEWARCATGDYGFPDEYPKDRLNNS